MELWPSCQLKETSTSGDTTGQSRRQQLSKLRFPAPAAAGEYRNFNYAWGSFWLIEKGGKRGECGEVYG